MVSNQIAASFFSVVEGGIGPLQDVVLISFLILENNRANAGSEVVFHRHRLRTGRLQPVCGFIQSGMPAKAKQWPTLTGTNGLIFALTFGPLPFPISLK